MMRTVLVCFIMSVSCGLNEVSGRVHDAPSGVANLRKDQERYNKDQSDCFHFVRGLEC